MVDKVSGIDEAVAGVADGAVVMVGGFGVPGTPFLLLEKLREHGASDLTLIKNDANEAGMGVDELLAAGQVSRLITSHIGLNPNAVAMMNQGTLDVEFCAQGILAERIRAGGAGLMGFVTDIGVGTDLAGRKPTVEVDGIVGLLETALRADIALIHAHRADRVGNLFYAATARNFNPLMAMAARSVVVEAEEVLNVGELDPAAIHTPGPFVDAVVPIGVLPGIYGVVQR